MNSQNLELGNDHFPRLGETVPFSREADAIQFVRDELAKGRSVTIWPVNDQSYTLAAQSNEQVA